jgi:hypothetical protein
MISLALSAVLLISYEIMFLPDHHNGVGAMVRVQGTIVLPFVVVSIPEEWRGKSL